MTIVAKGRRGGWGRRLPPKRGFSKLNGGDHGERDDGLKLLGGLALGASGLAGKQLLVDVREDSTLGDDDVTEKAVELLVVLMASYVSRDL